MDWYLPSRFCGVVFTVGRLVRIEQLIGSEVVHEAGFNNTRSTVLGTKDGLEIGPCASARSGKWGQLTPPGKMGEKLKSENMQKNSFLCICYILTAIMVKI